VVFASQLMSKPAPAGRSRHLMLRWRLCALRRAPMHRRSMVPSTSPPLSSTSWPSASLSGPPSQTCPSRSLTGRCSGSFWVRPAIQLTIVWTFLATYGQVRTGTCGREPRDAARL